MTLLCLGLAGIGDGNAEGIDYRSREFRHDKGRHLVGPSCHNSVLRIQATVFLADRRGLRLIQVDPERYAPRRTEPTTPRVARGPLTLGLPRKLIEPLLRDRANPVGQYFHLRRVGNQKSKSLPN